MGGCLCGAAAAGATRLHDDELCALRVRGVSFCGCGRGHGDDSQRGRRVGGRGEVGDCCGAVGWRRHSCVTLTACRRHEQGQTCVHSQQHINPQHHPQRKEPSAELVLFQSTATLSQLKSYGQLQTTELEDDPTTAAEADAAIDLEHLWTQLRLLVFGVEGTVPAPDGTHTRLCLSDPEQQQAAVRAALHRQLELLAAQEAENGTTPHAEWFSSGVGTTAGEVLASSSHHRKPLQLLHLLALLLGSPVHVLLPPPRPADNNNGKDTTTTSKRKSSTKQRALLIVPPRATTTTTTTTGNNNEDTSACTEQEETRSNNLHGTTSCWDSVDCWDPLSATADCGSRASGAARLPLQLLLQVELVAAHKDKTSCGTLAEAEPSPNNNNTLWWQIKVLSFAPCEVQHWDAPAQPGPPLRRDPRKPRQRKKQRQRNNKKQQAACSMTPCEHTTCSSCQRGHMHPDGLRQCMGAFCASLTCRDCSAARDQGMTDAERAVGLSSWGYLCDVCIRRGRNIHRPGCVKPQAAVSATAKPVTARAIVQVGGVGKKRARKRRGAFSGGC